MCVHFSRLPFTRQDTHAILFNSLWSCDVIWWHRSGSTLAQVMACCLMAPSHYLNQSWPHQWGPVTITSGQFHKKYIPQSSITKISLKIMSLKFHSNLLGANELKYWGLNKMATILQAAISNLFWKSKSVYYGSNFTEFFSKGAIDRNSALVEVMAWCWTGDKPLLEPVTTLINDGTYIWCLGHNISMDKNLFQETLLVFFFKPFNQVRFILAARKQFYHTKS